MTPSRPVSRSPSLGERIWRARLEAGLTQAQLAGTEIAVRTISRIERGYTVPSRRVLAYIARRVGRPLGYFLDGAAPVGEVDIIYLVMLARARRMAGDLEGAARAARDADDRAPSLGSLPVRWSAALERAVCELARTGSADNEARVRRAQETARRAGLHEDVWWAEYAVASQAAERGEHDRARAMLERLTSDIGDRAPELCASATALLVRLLCRRGPAVPALAARLDGIGRARSRRGVADALEAESRDAYAAGRPDEAAWAAQRAASIRSAMHAAAEEAKARLEVGTSFLASGIGDRAEAELARARALAREAGQPRVETQALVALSELYAGSGRLAEAAAVLEEAQSLCAGGSGAPRAASAAAAGPAGGASDPTYVSLQRRPGRAYDKSER